MIRDVCSHGSSLTQRVTNDGKNQISDNQRVSVGRTASSGEPNTDHLLFRFALNLETESVVRRSKKARHRWWMGLASNSFVYTYPHAVSPIKQLHSHPSTRPPSWDCDRAFPLPLLRSSSSLCPSLSSYVSLAVCSRSIRRTTDSSPEDFASKQFTIKLHAGSPPRSCARELQNGGYVMSDQK